MRPKRRDDAGRRTALRLLMTGGVPDPAHRRELPLGRGGILVQERDRLLVGRDALPVVTRPGPSEGPSSPAAVRRQGGQASQVECDRLRSQRGNGGSGRPMNRVDSVGIAARGRRGREGGDCRSPPRSVSVIASDAFFPFATVEAAIEAGVTAIIQPGGSIRDNDAIAAADAQACHVFTGMRHFRH